MHSPKRIIINDDSSIAKDSSLEDEDNDEEGSVWNEDESESEDKAIHEDKEASLSQSPKAGSEGKVQGTMEVAYVSMVADTLEGKEYYGHVQKLRAGNTKKGYKNDMEKCGINGDGDEAIKSNKSESTAAGNLGNMNHGPTKEKIGLENENKVGHENSDVISCTQVGLLGPIKTSNPNRKKALVDVYESLKIMYAPSYFTTPLQSQFNPNLKQTSTSNNHPQLSKKMDNNENSINSGDSITDSVVQIGSRRIQKTIESVPKKVQNTIKDLGIDGDTDDDVFEVDIREMDNSSKGGVTGPKEKDMSMK